MSAYENWRVEWAPNSQPDDPFPVWEDLTPWVETVGRPWASGGGRPTELDTTQDGHLSLTLNNTDHHFAAILKLARQIRIIETIGYRTFQIFRGYIELPDIGDWAEAGVDQFITVAAVDRLTRLGRGRTFISTLTEYILYNAGSGLQAYYPLLESAGTIAYDKSRYAREPLTLYYNRDSMVVPTQGGPQFTAGRGVVLPGDDLAAPALSPRLDANGQLAAESAELQVLFSNPITASASSGDVVTVAAWVTLSGMSPVAVAGVINLWNVFARAELSLSGATNWAVGAAVGANPVSFAVATPPTGVSQLIALRVTISTGQVEYWRHGDQPVVFSLASFASVSTWSRLWIGRNCIGSISHAQVYVGPTAYTRSMHLAQIQAGTIGLAGQTTGQRIRTVAAYAGIPAGEVSIDDGTVRMPNASLAGKSPLTPMREAETTEQGLLIANGAGELVFQDRIRRYNI